MTEYIDEVTTVQIDCEDCPLAVGLRFDCIDIEPSVSVRKTGQTATNVWDNPSSEEADIRFSVQCVRPRIVEVSFPVGAPSEADVYELCVELTYEGETVQYPKQPRHIEFSQ